MLQEKQSRLEALELKIFRFAGVKLFREVVFCLERVKHGKSNRKNENYHPFSFDVITLEKFTGFLLYNGLLHVISLLFVGAYIALSIAFDIRNTILDVILAVFLLLDIYCIALQRNSYLKVRAFCHRTTLGHLQTTCCAMRMLCNSYMQRRRRTLEEIMR